MGTRKNGRKRRRHPRVSPSRAPALSFAHYFQAPATQSSYLFTTVSPYQVFKEQLCSQKSMIWLHQTPVHLHIPNVRVNCAYECWKDPGKEVEVHLLFSGVLCWQERTTCQRQLQHHFFYGKVIPELSHTITFVSCRHCWKKDDKKCRGVFSSIGEMWELLFGIIISAQTLREAPPSREASKQRSQSILLATTLATI